MLRWRYDLTLSQLTNKADFREAGRGVTVITVLSAIAIAVHWMNLHPECGVAAWLQSGITTEAYYDARDASELAHSGNRLFHDPELQQIGTEYQRRGGMSERRTALLED